ncbi:PepSY domain-containing protein [Actinoplanes philippinensis]|uniref:PepSY domain-containing protein n=1 Tax=Actinoplanes philippinensis TaxID=35752 RepID=UPI0033C3EB38
MPLPAHTTAEVRLLAPSSTGHRGASAGHDEGAVRIDSVPAGLRVTDVVRFADHPFMAKLARWGVDIHMDTLFGLVNQIVLAVLAVGPALMVVLGYRMWWQPRPARASLKTPLRGVWLRLPAWLIAVGVPVVFAVGWFLPLSGVPLLAFLAVDVALGIFRQRKPVVPSA